MRVIAPVWILRCRSVRVPSISVTSPLSRVTGGLSSAIFAGIFSSRGLCIRSGLYPKTHAEGGLRGRRACVGTGFTDAAQATPDRTGVL